MVSVSLLGVKIVRKRLASGQFRVYHYAYRGGPLIWKTGYSYHVDSADYLSAYERAHRASRGYIILRRR